MAEFVPQQDMDNYRDRLDELLMIDHGLSEKEGEEMTREPATCHDCGCKEGQVHHFGCDMERCPFCGDQLITCGCVYKHLGIDCKPGTDVYENGLTKPQEATWLVKLNAKGRVPFVNWPVVCGYCGKLWPALFMLPEWEWQRYIELGKRDVVLCRACYDYIKSLIDA